MTYATQTDMVERFGQAEIQQLTDKNGLGAIDPLILGNALGDANATIDGYLAARYALPLTSIPASLPKRAADLARYYLYGGTAPDHVRANHDDAVSWLVQVSRGVVELGIDQPTQAAEVGAVRVVSNPRVFSANTLTDFGRF